MGSCIHKLAAKGVTTAPAKATWQKIAKTHCAGNTVGSAFKTAADAQKYCQQQGPSKCSGVYDDSCDGKGTFFACDTKTHLSSSMGSCIHKLAAKGVTTAPAKATWQKIAKTHCAGNTVGSTFKTAADAQKYC